MDRPWMWTLVAAAACALYLAGGGKQGLESYKGGGGKKKKTKGKKGKKGKKGGGKHKKKKTPKDHDVSASSYAVVDESGGGGGGGGGGGKCTITAYNIMSSDNTCEGCLNEWQVSRKFVDNVNVVAVHSDDWPAYKYKELEITYKGKSGRFQVWDYCADKDCGGCCSKNKNKSGNGFLTDIDSSAAKRVFGLNNAEDNLEDDATFRVVGSVNPDAVAAQFGAKPS